MSRYKRPNAKRNSLYHAAKDGTLHRHLRFALDEDLPGRTGLFQLIAGRGPTAAQVRIQASSYLRSRTGQGLHEWIPTSERFKLAKITSKRMRSNLAMLQSGARTTPALQPLIYKSQVGGHTGTFVNPRKLRASQGTSIQKDAHDILRSATSRASLATSFEHASNEVFRGGLDTTPTGRDLIDSSEIDGFTPNLKVTARGRTLGQIEPVKTNGVGANRLEYAREIHSRRELVKDRATALREQAIARGYSNLRSYSPKRTKIKADGSGGEHAALKKRIRALPEVPKFPTRNTEAHIAAWVTAPMRLKI